MGSHIGRTLAMACRDRAHRVLLVPIFDTGLFGCKLEGTAAERASLIQINNILATLVRYAPLCSFSDLSTTAMCADPPAWFQIRG